VIRITFHIAPKNTAVKNKVIKGAIIKFSFVLKNNPRIIPPTPKSPINLIISNRKSELELKLEGSIISGIPIFDKRVSVLVSAVVSTPRIVIRIEITTANIT
jgi:hypothetical protein